MNPVAAAELALSRTLSATSLVTCPGWVFATLRKSPAAADAAFSREATAPCLLLVLLSVSARVYTYSALFARASADTASVSFDRESRASFASTNVLL